jgi:Fur family ferric uptake transcriptional regulator
MDNLQLMLQNYGLRITEARLVVLAALLRSHRVYDHPTLLDACGGKVDRVTLYRTLQLFYEHRIVYKLPSPSGPIRYGLRSTEEDGHLHMICESCGREVSVDHFSLPGLVLPRGFRSLNVDMIVSGFCRTCAAKR